MRTERQRAGDTAEDLVAGRLQADGWTILARQLHVGRGELDIVGVDPGPPARLAVVEVRWRSGRGFGLPEETFDRRKRQRLTKACQLLMELGLPDGRRLPRLPLRIDLVVVEPPVLPGADPRVRHHRNALGS